MPAFRPLAERFWEKVEKAAQDQCWRWLGAVTNYPDGPRGRIRLSRERRTEYAYRVAFILVHGEIPEEKIICHKCGNPLCVNPGHLYAGSPHDNNMDRVRHGRQSGGMPAGEGSITAKLTETKVKAIRQRFAAGGVGTEIAREFGISNAQASRIKLGQSWKHLEKTP